MVKDCVSAWFDECACGRVHGTAEMQQMKYGEKIHMDETMRTFGCERSIPSADTLWTPTANDKPQSDRSFRESLHVDQRSGKTTIH